MVDKQIPGTIAEVMATPSKPIEPPDLSKATLPNPPKEKDPKRVKIPVEKARKGGPDYGKVKEYTATRTISLGGFEMLTVSIKYQPGLDDTEDTILGKVAQWNDSVDSSFTTLRGINDAPKTIARPVAPPSQPTQSTQPPQTDSPPANRNKYRVMYAIWHSRLNEDPKLKPTSGMSSAEADDYIRKYGDPHYQPKFQSTSPRTYF